MATSHGTVKKTPLTAFSRPRSTGIIAVDLRDDDRLIGVEILSAHTIPESQIAHALTGHAVDTPSVIAAWHAGVAAPDREVVVGPAHPD